MSAQKYRKMPVEIEAMRWDGTPEGAAEIVAWTANSETPAQFLNLAVTNHDGSALVDSEPSLSIRALQGRMRVDPGGYVIRGVRGEHYPCKPDIFNATYEPVGNRS